MRIKRIIPFIMALTMLFAPGCSTGKKNNDTDSVSNVQSSVSQVELSLSSLDYNDKNYSPIYINNNPQSKEGIALVASPYIESKAGRTVILFKFNENIENKTIMSYYNLVFSYMNIEEYIPETTLTFTDINLFKDNPCVVSYILDSNDENAYGKWDQSNDHSWTFAIDSGHSLLMKFPNNIDSDTQAKYIDEHIKVIFESSDGYRESDGEKAICPYPYVEDILSRLLTLAKCYIKNANDISYFNNGLVGIGKDYIICQPTFYKFNNTTYSEGTITSENRNLGIMEKNGSYFVDVFEENEPLFRVKLINSPLYINLLKFVESYLSV